MTGFDPDIFDGSIFDPGGQAAQAAAKQERTGGISGARHQRMKRKGPKYKDDREGVINWMRRSRGHRA